MVVITRDRYVVMQIIAQNNSPNLSALKSEIWKEFQLIFGIDGASSAGLYFEHFDEKSKACIIRCDHKALTNLMIALARISSIGGIPTILFPVYTTGLIKKAKTYLKII